MNRLDSCSPERTSRAIDLNGRHKSLRVASSLAVLFLNVAGLVKEALAEEVPLASCISEAEIKGLEDRFLELGNQVLAKLDKHVQDPVMKERIRKIFTLMRENKNSPRCTPNNQVVPLGQEANNFGYAFTPSHEYSTTFTGQYRLVLISTYADMKGTSLLLQLMHELAHVDQDNGWRQTVSPDKYSEFWSSSGLQVILESEEDAAARSIEVLNIMTDGALKKAVQQKRRISLPIRDAEFAETMRILSEAYYSDRENFAVAIKKLYEKEPGAVFFTQEFEPVRESAPLPLRIGASMGK